MKLFVLGNQGPYPGCKGACSGYLVEQDGFRLLLDCGSGVLAKLQEVCSIQDVNAVILSHLHSDHMADMLVLRYALPQLSRRGLRQNKPLPVIMPDSPEAERKLLEQDSFSVTEMTEGRGTHAGPFEVEFLRVKHPVPCYAVALTVGGHRLVYSADTLWDEKLIDFARGADIFLCDAGLLECDRDERSPHPSAMQAAEMAARAKVGRLLLTHLWPGYQPERILEEARGIFPQAELAEPAMMYEL